MALVAWAAIFAVQPALTKNDLFETPAQKGVITMAEYEKLKTKHKTEVTMTTDDDKPLALGSDGPGDGDRRARTRQLRRHAGSPEASGVMIGK